MKSKLTSITTVIFLLFYNCCYADTFIVTSNADNGPGTLREALQKAADNGTSVTDNILFNLPNSSRADRTIILDSTLPRLSSNLVIDGTSQNGTPFGISDARVQIENKRAVEYFTCFEALLVENIQIYGLYLKGNGASFAMHFRQLNNMTFGRPGKGNIVNGFAQAFYSDLVFFSDPPSNNISFQSNLFGIDESGDTTTSSTFNHTHFEFDNVYNLLIGGLGKDEGNLMCDNNHAMSWTCTTPDDSGYLRIEGNKIGTDRTGLKRLIPHSQGFFLDGYNDGNADNSGTSKVDLNIINNISAEPFSLSKFRNYFKIQGNKFGVGSDNVTNIGQYSYCLSIIFCAKGIIGGSDDSDKNYIANFPPYAVFEFISGAITISKNSFFCNEIGIVNNLKSNEVYPFVTINKISSIQVAGTALPNSIIELFYDDACPGCEGKTYIGSATADANGKWIYNGNNTGGIVATATDTYGATSEFSTATINTDSVQVKDASCGKANGAIKHLLVVSGTDWHWEDEAGKVISGDTDLVNVSPGKYKFVTSIGGNSCKTESTVYEIKNVDQPSIDISLISMQQPSCGMNNGALKNNAAFNDLFQYQWINKAGEVILNDFNEQHPFTDLAPADYYLKLLLRHDSTCFTKYGPFTLVNQSGPSLHTDNINITNSSCNANNGSIKNISYQNATAPLYTAWEDSTGKIVGNQMDLEAMGEGKYRLRFKDGSNCDTILTPYFVIADKGTITVDTSLMIVEPASCKGSDGSITKITSTNATTFTWIDMATGNVVGNNPDIYDLPSGTYHLQLKNSYGCPKILQPVFIGNDSFLADTVVDVSIRDATCFLDNGAITINRFSRDSSLYSFAWTNNISGAVISTHASIQNVPPGSYTLTATDPRGCSAVIFSWDITQFGKPGFDTHALKIWGDTCYSGIGAVQDLLTRNSSWIDTMRSYTWAWYDKDHRKISSLPQNLFAVPAGTYYATITDQFNCTETSDLFTITNQDIIPGKPQVSDQYIPRYTSAGIAVVNPREGMYELLNDDLPGSLALASSATGSFQTPAVAADRSFFVRYKNGDCVSQLSKVEIKVFDSTIIYVPNAFSPGNDGLNDQFRVKVQGRLKSFSISVYNRFGNVVHTATDINRGWNGTVKGEPAPSGVYIYVITALTYENKSISQKGIITLLR